MLVVLVHNIFGMGTFLRGGGACWRVPLYKLLNLGDLNVFYVHL